MLWESGRVGEWETRGGSSCDLRAGRFGALIRRVMKGLDNWSVFKNVCRTQPRKDRSG